MLITWLLIAAAAAVAWAGRKPVSALLCEGIDRLRGPRRVELVAPPRLDRWPDLDPPARDRGVAW